MIAVYGPIALALEAQGAWYVSTLPCSRKLGQRRRKQPCGQSSGRSRSGTWVACCSFVEAC